MQSVWLLGIILLFLYVFLTTDYGVWPKKSGSFEHKDDPTAIEQCYRTEVREYENPTFKNIKTSYILTMENSPRRDQYLAQLEKYRPTARVVILHNKGFKNCSKPSWVNTPAFDLWHANVTAMNAHFTHDASPVLILEDDVQFFDNFFEEAPKIEAFMADRPKVELYTLGSLPWLSTPVNFDHFRIWIGSCSHAFIYTKEGADKMRSLNPHDAPFGVHDVAVLRTLKSYGGKRPSAYQVVEETENSKAWNDTANVLSYMQAFGTGLYPFHHQVAMLGSGAVAVVIVFEMFTRYKSRQRLTIAKADPISAPEATQSITSQNSG